LKLKKTAFVRDRNVKDVEDVKAWRSCFVISPSYTSLVEEIFGTEKLSTLSHPLIWHCMLICDFFVPQNQNLLEKTF